MRLRPTHAAMFAAALWCVGAVGCVQRTITITSEPPGALVWLNDREIGRTPVDVEFLHYGTYDVRLQLAGHEPLMTRGDAMPPWWDNVGLDFFAEMVPGARSDVAWHYVLAPAANDPEALVQRANDLRAKALEGMTELPHEAPETERESAEPPIGEAEPPPAATGQKPPIS
jgi:hypothetical protein